jgi:hypothetical protein
MLPSLLRSLLPSLLPSLLSLSILFLLAPVAAQAAADPNQPQSYEVRLPVALQPNAPLQRIILPAQVLAHMQSSAMNDLRVFNAQGQPLPMAVSENASLLHTERNSVALKSFPILGASDATNVNGMSLRIEEQAGRRVVQIDSKAQASASDRTVLGALLDARDIGDPAVGMQLDADLPEGQPITFDVQASPDLKNWQSLGQTVLFRAQGLNNGNGTAANSIALDGADLNKRYLRVTWTDAAGLPAPVVVRGATITTARGVANAPSAVATLSDVQLDNAHEVHFTLPFATPVAGLRIKPQGDNVLIPIRVLGRNDRSQTWTPMASGVIYRMTAAGKTQDGGAIALPAGSFREIKIEADKKTAGFTAIPDITLEFQPVQIVVLASGGAPFTLAAGLAGAPASTLPMPSLIPGYRDGGESKLPLAAVDTAVSPNTVVVALGSQDGLSTRSIVLWGILLLAALALGVMAWILLRQHRAPGSPGQSV